VAITKDPEGKFLSESKYRAKMKTIWGYFSGFPTYEFSITRYRVKSTCDPNKHSEGGRSINLPFVNLGMPCPSLF
jgi:hypothetical protein